MTSTKSEISISVKWSNQGRMYDGGESSVDLRNFLVYLGFAEIEIIVGLQKICTSTNLYEMLSAITSFLNDADLRQKKYQLIVSGDSIEFSREGDFVRMKLFDYLKRSDVDLILSELQIRELHEKLKKHLLSLLEGVLPRSVRYETSEIDLA